MHAPTQNILSVQAKVCEPKWENNKIIINAAATIAGPNGKYVLFEGFSRKPLNINIQDKSPKTASNKAPNI